MHKARCPECNEFGEQVCRFSESDSIEIVYVCENNEGFLLPKCMVAEWVTVFDEMGAFKKVTKTKDETIM